MDEIATFYSLDLGRGRLSRGLGLIEYIRTLDVLAPLLPEPPATVLDIGGGTGVYALAAASGLPGTCAGRGAGTY